jgi:ADP-ribosylation factor-like protein 2
LIWVVDSADQVRLEICKKELCALLDQEKLAGASLLIFANKQDVRGSLDADGIAEALGLREDTSFLNRHWSIRGCSAVTGEGLVEGMDWMVDDVANRIFMLS